MKKEELSLYLVTDRGLAMGRSLEFVVEQAVQGGVSMVQLREKDCSSLEFYEQALALKKIVSARGVPLIINDRLDIALAVDADGLHIGQRDLPWQEARRILGKDKIIGLSVENIRDALDANDAEIDYIGISPVFSTPTKQDTQEALGLDGVREIARLSCHPTVAIGGINRENTSEIIANGADGVAVVSAIMSAIDPKKAAEEFSLILKNTKK